MNLELNEEQKLLQRTVREFAESEVKPLAREIDETGQFPRETFRKAAELGLTAVALPESEGGAGFDHISYSIVIEEISRVCASTGVILSVQNSLYCDPLHRFGTEEQKKQFLAPFARGEKIGCYALTEPQAGSNAAALATQAVRQGDRYVINGTKAWITNGGVADAAIVYVNTDPAKGEKGITALLVERGTPGFQSGQGRKEDWAFTPRRARNFRSPIAKCPLANRIGNEGEGYKVALSTLDGGRIGIAAQATGIAQGAFEQALAYAQRAAGVRPSHRRFSGDPVHAGRHGHGNRRGAPAGAQGGVEAGYRRRDFPWRLRSRSFLRRNWPRASRTKPCRFTAATATAANIRSSACTATRASRKFTKARAKFSGW